LQQSAHDFHALERRRWLAACRRCKVSSCSIVGRRSRRISREKAAIPKRWSCQVLVASLIGGFFAAVVCAYGFTEYLLVQLDVRRRMVDGGVRTLVIILAANLMSFTILWVSSLVFVAASGAELYFYATIVCVCAQAVWLGQHLWSYYRDRPRLRYEQ
jgi:hypothetical protein